MKQTIHYAHPTGFALGLTSGVLYTVCAVAVSVWPLQTLRFFNSWMHAVDLTKVFMPPQITPISFLRGLISIIIAGYLTGVLFGWIYNKCVTHCTKKGWI